MKSMRGQDLVALVWIVQGVYYMITGVWSIIGIKSFQKVTGPKVDIWLVKTVGVIVLVIGAVLTSAGTRRVREPEIPALAVGSALGLAGINVFYSLRGRISKVYLLDAAAELGIVAIWLGLRRNDARQQR